MNMPISTHAPALQMWPHSAHIEDTKASTNSSLTVVFVLMPRIQLLSKCYIVRTTLAPVRPQPTLSTIPLRYEREIRPRRCKSWRMHECKKLFLTTQRFIEYWNLYVTAGRWKESMETETRSSTRQREATYHGEKKRSGTDIKFFLILTCLSAGSRLWSAAPKLGLVNFCLLTSS